MLNLIRNRIRILLLFVCLKHFCRPQKSGLWNLCFSSSYEWCILGGFTNRNKARKNKTGLFLNLSLVYTRSTVIYSFVLFYQSKKCFNKDCTGACLRRFCEEPDLPSCTRYTTVHHVSPLVEHACHDLPHPPACCASFAGMKLHFLRHASPNSPACIADVASIRLRSCQCTSTSKCIVAFFDTRTQAYRRPATSIAAFDGMWEFRPVVRNIAAFHNKEKFTRPLSRSDWLNTVKDTIFYFYIVKHIMYFCWAIEKNGENEQKSTILYERC
jgi:hypothetical protein